MSETENSPIIENTVDVAVVALDQGVEHLNSLIYAAAAMAAEAKKDFTTMAKEEMVEFMQKVKNDVNKEIKKLTIKFVFCIKAVEFWPNCPPGAKGSQKACFSYINNLKLLKKCIFLYKSFGVRAKLPSGGKRF